MDMSVQAVSLSGSQMLLLSRTSCDEEGNNSTEASDVTLPRKLLVRKQWPVPQTDTGSRGEHPKVSERTLVKELGKMTP